VRSDSLMLHVFSGDPWGPCSQCAHSAAHEIHCIDAEELAERMAEREARQAAEGELVIPRNGQRCCAKCGRYDADGCSDLGTEHCDWLRSQEMAA
jgi:hypothetical protein